jgi:type IV pilus assembly protein PilB
MDALPAIFSVENCQKNQLAPIINNGTIKSVLINDKTDLNILSLIRFNMGKDIKFTKVSDNELESAISQLAENNSQPEDSNSQKTFIESIDHSIIELIDNTISEAISLKASDIHLEPFEQKMSVRYRLDGILQHRRSVRKEDVPAIVSRIKIMSGLDIAEKRRPQDGRIRFKYEGRTVDIRVSVLPTDFGEKAVLRLLDKSAVRLNLDELGFDENNLNLLKEKIKLPNGVILITGPTGSGKTTTLYGALNFIKSPKINITTIEDPIEYNLEGINQTQIKPEIDLTFAKSLRAILRQDPNVIMVGEIRDRETLDNALRASLTGHLVFSTVHTNDAVSTIARLVDLGAEKYLLRSALKLIVAQRLVRKICSDCKTKETDSTEYSSAQALGMSDRDEIYQGKGCDKCLSIGYKGRTAIYEMLPVDESICDELLSESRIKEISEFLKKRRILSLRERGIELIRKGVTTPSEVLRETG